jgi:hypothetical protein
MDAPVKVREQLPRVVRFDPREIRHAVREVEGFNAKLALVITRSVGTMACAYVFAAIALISLPAAISSGQVIIIVAWVAQTFLQLVLLSIIMVGQTVQSAASDARAAKEFADAETIVDRLDVNTARGIRSEMSLTRSTRSATWPERRRRARPRRDSRIDQGYGGDEVQEFEIVGPGVLAEEFVGVLLVIDDCDGSGVVTDLEADVGGHLTGNAQRNAIA